MRRGSDICESFYRQCVLPVVEQHAENPLHAAGLIDYGSEVLGFDDELSRDHHWGPRVLLFLNEENHQRDARRLHQALAENLPHEFEGYPTNWSRPDPNDNGVQHLQPTSEGPVNHRVEIHTIPAFLLGYLGFDIEKTLEPADWLSFSEQRLRTITTGPVYHDAIGLNEIRERLTYYPRDVWLYLLAAGWTRISQDEHLMGRAGSVGDELGSAIIGARLARDIMRLYFLMERHYAPYAKWLGTAFNELRTAHRLRPVLEQVVHSTTWQDREQYLVEAYEMLAAAHNLLKLTDPLDPRVTSFHGRPFKVITLQGFAKSIVEQIRDPVVQKIAERPLVGGLDLLSDNSDLTENLSWRMRVRSLYE